MMTQRLKPTPGPWQVVTPGYTVKNRHDACIEVVTADYKAICHVYERRRGHKMNAIPNAELIAAAPDLLEACQAFVEAWEKCLQLEKTDTALRLAKAAIAKAGGEEA